MGRRKQSRHRSGAKDGGGYYGYVSNKFSNRMIVVDGDPNGDGNPSDAMIAGSVVLNAGPTTKTDDVIIGTGSAHSRSVMA